MLATTVKRARKKRSPAAKSSAGDLKKRYELVMGAINESVYDWDIAHDRFVTSGTMQHLLGLPRERLTLAGWQNSIHPEDFPRFREATVAHFKGLTQRFECDYRFRAQDGTWRWARTHGLATRDKRGRAIRMVGSTGDITELKSTEEQQAAVTEILAAMSSSPTDTGPVFEAIVQRALRLFPDAAVYIRIPQGAEVRLVAIAHRDPKQVARLRKQAPVPLTREYLHGAAILDRRVVDVVDAATHDEASIAAGLRNFLASGYRAVTIMPMLRGDTAIGTIAVARQNAGPLAERQVALLRTFADEAVIAIENVRLFNETREALDRQTATAEILTVMSNSTTEVQPVFDAIVKNVQRLFATRFAVLQLVRDGQLELVAFDGQPGFERITAEFPRPLSGDSIGAKAIRARDTVQLAPVVENPDAPERSQRMARMLGYNSVIGTPMVRPDGVIGAIVTGHEDGRPFTDKQAALLKAFADQAVIAIENARLFNETKEALEQQTATAEILGVVAQSQTDLQPVFDAIARNATRLCGALFSCVYRFDGELVHLVATHNLPAAGQEVGRILYPMRPDRSQLSGRVVLTRGVQRLEDVAQDAEYAMHVASAGGWRRLLAVPMLREEKALGVIAVGWRDPGPILDRQVELLKTFADQAVIAIENARLFNETKEALERQTVTAEILKVISGSPTNTQPVFDAIVQSGLRLFSNAAISIALPDGALVQAAAVAESDPSRAAAWRSRFPFPLTREYMHGMAILERQVIDIPDVRHAPGAMGKGAANFLASGYRGVTIMPMMRGEEAIGALSVVRRAAGPLTDRQVNLLKTFADQAVIAIENVRLLNETKEALEHQKASGEVLEAISGSIADTQPVFDKILDSCERLFAGRIVGLNVMGKDGMLHIGAYHGAHRDEFARIFPIPITRESGSGLAIVERRVVHYADAQGGAEVPERTRKGCKAIGIKSAIFAPVLWEGRGLGAIFVGRDHLSSFSNKEIALLKTFADQAAIAIENARLFNEIQQKSHQLETASRHKSEFLANMSHELRTPLNAIIGFTRIVMRRSKEALEEKQYENLEKILASGQHLLALINAILDLSKVEAGRVELTPADTALVPVLEQCLRTVEPLVKVSLVREFDGGLPRIYVDEEKLRQIVINLLSNAAKFTEQGSIRLRAQAANGSVAIAVADSGIGIAPDKLGLIFEEFEQVDASSTREHGGTGLGLAIARRLARLMGGDIGVESSPGSGSTFTLTLPLRQHG